MKKDLLKLVPYVVGFAALLYVLSKVLPADQNIDAATKLPK